MSKDTPKSPGGKLVLVGTGPGHPELLTLKAVRTISGAMAVAFANREGRASRAFETVREYVGPGTRLLPFELPMLTDRMPAHAAYDAMADILDEQLNDGHLIAYLCEGDPLFYGSAIFLLDRLGADHSVEVVPGVTSLTATAASALWPLATRNDVLKVLPAPLSDEILRPELMSGQSFAIIKLGRHFDRVRALLDEMGLGENAMVVTEASGPGQSIVPLREFTATAPYFATILLTVGQTP